MAFTKVVGPGIHTLAQLRTHNIHSAGIITATKFVGEMESGGGSSTFQNVTVSGNLTVQGDTTTLNTTLRNVELLRVAANTNTTAGIITQTGTGDILNLFDATTEVMTVVDGGKVGIGVTNPSTSLQVANGHINLSSGYSIQWSDSHERIEQSDSTLEFFTGNGQKMALSGDNLGIGITNPTGKLHISHSAGRGIFVDDNSNSSTSPYIQVLGRRSDGNTQQSFTGQIFLSSLRTDQKVASGKQLGTVLFGGNHTDGTEANILYAASIAGVADDNFDSATDMPTALVFKTGTTGRAPLATNVSSGDERLRITSAGALNIGKGDEAGAVENLVELYVGGNDTSHATIRGKYNRTNEYNRSEVRFGVESNAAGKGFLAFATGTNSASERLRITSGGCVYSSNFGIGTDSNWKIRPNTSNTELAFEYATSSTLADTNIKAFFRSGGSFVLKSDPLAAGGTMGDRGLIFQANSTPTDGQVIQGITFCPHPTAIARARAGIAGVANANGGSHPQSGADLVFMTRYSADGHDLDVTTDERLRIDSSGKIKLNQTDSMIMTNADASRLRLFGGSSNSVSNGAALTLQGVSHSGGNYADLASGTGGHIQFRTGTTERLRIDSSGRLLIGAQRSYSGQGYYDDITINNSNTASGSAGGTGISLISGNNTWGAILFGDSDDDDVGAIKYSHIDNHMRFNTAGGIRFRIDADGVKFNGDTSSANALDDYEEGQWTPTIQFSSGGNTATYTSNRGGWYVKVGRLVTLNGRIEISAKGSGSSAVYFGGLPFTVGNHNSGTSGVEGGLTFSYMANVNADKGSGIIGGYASENTTQVIPFYVDTSNNFHYVEDFDLDSDASIGFTITYCV